MQSMLLQRLLNDGLPLELCIEPLLLDLAKLVRPRRHVPHSRHVDSSVRILSLSLLDDLTLSRSGDHGALATLMFGAKPPIRSGFDINLVLGHCSLLRLGGLGLAQ